MSKSFEQAFKCEDCYNRHILIHYNVFEGNETTAGEKTTTHSMLTPHQISALEAVFTSNYYLNKNAVMQVAQHTGLCKERILSWFKNKRRSIKRRKDKDTISIGEYMYIHIKYLNTSTYTHECVHVHAFMYLLVANKIMLVGLKLECAFSRRSSPALKRSSLAQSARSSRAPKAFVCITVNDLVFGLKSG